MSGVWVAQKRRAALQQSEMGGSMTPNAQDPVPALDRATAVAVNLYDRAAGDDDQSLRASALLLLAHLRAARRAAE